MRYLLTSFCLILGIFLSCQVQPQSADIPEQDSLLGPLIAERSSPDSAIWDSLLQQAAQKHGIDWMLAKAVMIKESHFVERHVSYAGAVGLMQLMPREGSYVSPAYRAYQQARKASGRVYKGKSQEAWGKAYQAQLLAIAALSSVDSIYQQDKRFDPAYNIDEGTRQLASDFHFFRSRAHGPYTSQILAIAAYNAGRYAVMTDRNHANRDHIPINRQTELYVAGVQKIYLALQSGDGQLLENDLYLLKL
ncbi:MAG: transglycosylase SLT domain-containing protein [Bacteroidota bacterium]